MDITIKKLPKDKECADSAGQDSTLCCPYKLIFNNLEK
jgi:hypothetical protein